jgi:hypothetical protein
VGVFFFSNLKKGKENMNFLLCVGSVRNQAKIKYPHFFLATKLLTIFCTFGEMTAEYFSASYIRRDGEIFSALLPITSAQKLKATFASQSKKYQIELYKVKWKKLNNSKRQGFIDYFNQY